MNRFGKIATSVTAVVLVGCITITSVTLLSRKELVVAEDNVSFNGTDALKQMNSAENPLKMIELVPSQDMGELSYVFGQEDWETALKTKNQEERKTYMTKTLYNNWYGLFHKGDSDHTDTMPLAYTEYSEVYALKDGESEADYKQLELGSTEVLSSVNSSGYEMVEEGDYKGDYLFVQPYFVAPKDSEGNYQGQFCQRVSQYIYSEKADQNYEVSFEYVPDQELEETQDLYVASQSKYIASEEQFNKIKEDTPGAYIYCIDYNNMYGPYEFVSQVSKLNYSDLQKGYYYTVGFSHIDKDQVVKGKKYYKIKNVKFVGKPGEDGSVGGTGTGEYAANAGAVYDVAKEDETGYFIEDPTRWMYKYVGQGNGNYHLVRKDGASIPYDVQIGRIYYKGGYVNNRIWDKYVFNVKAGEEEINYDVATMDPEMLNTYCQKTEIVEGKDEVTAFKDIDLLYISSRSLLKENAINKNTWTGDNKENVAFSKMNDITWETARKILLFAKNSEKRMPIIVDRSIINGQDISTYKDSNVTNMQRLVALLSSEQFFHNAGGKSEIEITETTSVDEIKWEELRIPWTKSIGRLYGDEFINQNVFLFYGQNDNKTENPALTPYIFKDFIVDQIAKGNDGATVQNDADFKKLAGNCGVEEIADYIIEENEKRSLENNGLEEGHKYLLFSYEISKSTMIDYILSFEIEEEIPWDGVINILEIQPGRTSDNKATLKEDTLKSALNKYNVTDVKVTYMTSSEFVGKIEDLTMYDLIYFGMDTSAFNKETIEGVTTTVYNDSSMNGLIYSNVGDIVAVANKDTNLYMGMLDSDYYDNDRKKGLKYFSYTGDGLKPNVNDQETYRKAHATMRYTGNDISREKLREVENFVKAGYPVVVDTNFFEDETKKVVNDYYIDNCSYMYELMENIKSYNCVLVTDKVENDTTLKSIMKYVGAGRPEITILNNNYATNTTDGEGTKGHFFEVNNDTLELKFKVTNRGTANSKQKLIARLYLDVNADGKFSKTREEVSALDMVLTQNEVEIPIKSEHNGETITYYYEVQPGNKEEYCFHYELPLGTVGLIPYKLIVGQKDNTLRTVSKQGYFYNVNQNKNDVPTIRVLQINTSNARIEKQKKGDSTSGSPMSFDMEDEYYHRPDSQFKEYMDKVKDFKLNVKTISSDDYAVLYNAAPSTFFDTCVRGEAADMLIIGFGDSYEIKDEQAMNGIIGFINSGKPVLFTHDTTSFRNDKEEAWGYQFNSKIRNLVGMDRYGVLSNPYLRKGDILTASSNNTEGDFEKAVEYAKNRGSDIPYVPRSDKTQTVRQTQGIANTMMFYYTDGYHDPSKIVKSMNYDFPYSTEAMSGYSGNSRKTTNVEQINKGQITSYPFVIPETFTVATTHAQYYQLDFNEDSDNDGECDIVVWYTLKGAGSYDCSPKDVRNNYYIYTKGNVTYSGVGHYRLNATDVKDEIKLYINTMIAAYNSGTKAPNVSLKDGADEDATNVNTLYISFDEILDKKVAEDAGTKEMSIEEQMEVHGKNSNIVYFTITDKNIVKNLKERVVEATFAVLTDLKEEDYENLSKEEKEKYTDLEIDGKKAYLKIFNPKILTLEGKEAKTKSSAVTYCAQIPGNIMDGKSNITVYMIAKTKFTRQLPEYNDKGELVDNPKTIVEYSPNTVTSFRVRRMGLTDLD